MSSIDKDERLLPLPNVPEMNLVTNQDIPANYAPFYDDENFYEGRSLREYFLIIYKKLPLILAMTILVTAAVAFYMYRQPSLYQAETILVIDPPKPRVQTGQNVYIQNYSDNENYYNTQIRLLKNPDLMQEVVNRLQLYKDPTLFGQQKGFLSSLKSLVSVETIEDKKDALPVINTSDPSIAVVVPLTDEEKATAKIYSSTLAASLIAERQERTNLVNIKVTSTNPQVAAQVANTVAEVHKELDAKRATQGAEEQYKDLSKSIDELKTTIAEKEQQRIQQMKEAGLALGDKGGDINSARLTALSTNFIQAEDERRKAQADYEAAVEAAKRGEIYAVANDKGAINDARRLGAEREAQLETRIEAAEKNISEAEAKLSQLLVKYTDEYAEVKQVKAQIQKLKDDKTRLETEVAGKITKNSKDLKRNAESEIITGLAARLAASRRREAETRSAYYQALGISNQQGQAESRLTTLTNEIETQRTLLNTLTQSQKQMELTISSNRPDNISVSSKAQDGYLVGPQRNRNIILAFLLSLGFGVGLAFLLDYLDDSIKTSDDVGKSLALPTLAVIPHQSVVGKRRNAIASESSPGGSLSTALISIEDNRSATAEAYRHLRTSLLFSSAGKPPQTILVTSSQPSEGKTTTAMNLAITLAQAGADVVIIDCDLRRPRLHQHFGMDNSAGLTNYLSGEKNPNNLLKPFAQLPRLKVVTSGPIPPNPAELLSSGEMKNFLTYLKGQFNHVIVDSPPAISFTDAAVLSTLVDGVVLVAMSGKSSAQLLRRFKQRMSAIGTKIFGVVLNGVKPDSYEYGYYGYGYEYSYYDDDDQTTPKMEEAIEVERAEK